MKTNHVISFGALAVLIFNALALAPTRGQGSLTPPGSLAPSMKSLQEIWDHLGVLESKNSALRKQQTVLQQQLEPICENLVIALPWEIITIDSTGTVGRPSSLAFTPAGQPAISYVDDTNDDLKYALFDGANWWISTVTRVVGTDMVIASTSLAISPAGLPAIAYDVMDGSTGAYTMNCAILNGTSWNTKYVSYLFWRRGYPSLAFSPGGQPAIAFDASDGTLKYAVSNGTTWQVATVDTGASVSGGASLAFTPGGQPAISYYDAVRGTLKYAVRAPFTAP